MKKTKEEIRTKWIRHTPLLPLDECVDNAMEEYASQCQEDMADKIKEAYDMLKKQGLVTEDPVYVDKLVVNVTPRHDRNSVFEDEEKSKQLARLLKSKNPQDLELANRLIKNMVKQVNLETKTLLNKLELIV